MADYIQDKKLTQDQTDRLQAPMELDLTALFKVVEEDLINQIEDFEGNPDALINSITQGFREPAVPEEPITKSLLYKKAEQFFKHKVGK